MPLSLFERYQIGWKAVATADVDLLSKAMLHPESIQPGERKTIAQSLGFEGGFLNAIVDVATDPSVWLAMWFSRRMPRSGYFTGAVPHRHVGANAEFGGLSFITSTVDRTFAGTPVPHLSALIGMRKAQVMRLGKQYHRLVAPLKGDDHDIVSLLLEGQSPVGATAFHKGRAAEIRQVFEEGWDMLKQVHTVEGGLARDGTLTAVSSRPPTPQEAPRYIRDFLPHMPLFNELAHIEISTAEALKRMGRGRAGQVMAAAGESADSVWTQGMLGETTSNFTAYHRYMNRAGKDVFGPRIFHRKRHNTLLASAQGDELFITDLNQIGGEYFERLSNTYANFAPLTAVEQAAASTNLASGFFRPSAEPPIVQVLRHGTNATFRDGIPKTRPKQIAGTQTIVQEFDPAQMNKHVFGSLQHLVRTLEGRLGEDRVLTGNLLNAVTKSINDTLPDGRTKDRIVGAIRSMAHTDDPSYLNRKIASFFYGTTLGGNVRSVVSNMFQPFLTTQTLGIGSVLEGYGELARRLPAYFSNFSKEFKALRGVQMPRTRKMAVALDRAYEGAFPELSHAGIVTDISLLEANAPRRAVNDILGGERFGVEDLTRLLLTPFTQAERANQVNAFFAAKYRIRKDLRMGLLDLPDEIIKNPKNLEEWTNLNAGKFVSSSQFVPVEGSQTRLQAMLPAPLRMFTSFPTRLYNFHTQSTITGAMADAQLKTTSIAQRLFKGFGPGGQNWSTVANTYIAGRVITEGLSETLGVDMGHALGLLNPLNLGSGDRMPFPFSIPPAPALALGMGQAFINGDWKTDQPMTLLGLGEVNIPKTLIPGGVAISRFSRAMLQFKPDIGGFTDDDERLLFRGNTPDMFLSALGIPLEKKARFRSTMDQLHANRLRIRELRRGFTLQMVNGNIDEAQRFMGQYQQEFPDMAAIAPLAASSKDIMRYRQAQNITAVQRMLKTLPGGGSTLINGIDEDLLAF